MPPKNKRGRPAASATAQSRSTRTADPIITTKNGKEIETTAAAMRPRRDSVATAASSSTTGSTTTTPKKRGRPPKASTEDEPPAKRGRKTSTTVPAPVAAKKRGPGRPPKKSTTKKALPAKATAAAEKTNEDAADDAEAAAPVKKRGRPAAKKATAAPSEPGIAPRKRGRPPKGGETTKIDTDDAAAAEQLEEELQDDADESSLPTSKSKGKAPVVKDTAADNDEEDGANDSGKNFWLMKAEQEDREEVLANGTTFNTKFTIDDLRAKSQPEPWDGVRNPTAAKNMRDMKKGDLAFFYASGGKGGRKPGIVGIMEIVKEHEPDQTAWDEGAYGYVKNEKMRDRWCVVHVEFRKKLVNPVHLSELQKYKEPRGALANLQEFKAARLSVSKVTEKEWNFILGLVEEGYETYDNDGRQVAEETKSNIPSDPARADA